MMDIEKYLSNKGKKKPRPLVEATMHILTRDELYEQGLMQGGVGIDSTMKMIMQAANGEETTVMQPYANSSSDGMTIL